MQALCRLCPGGLASRLMHAAQRAHPHATSVAAPSMAALLVGGRLQTRTQAAKRTVRTTAAPPLPAPPLPVEAAAAVAAEVAPAAPAAAAPAKKKATKPAPAAPVAAAPPAGPVLLVDGHSLAFRSYYAMMTRPGGGLSTRSRGTPTSVTACTLKALKAIIRQVNPRSVVVTFDSGASFRKELLARLEQLCAAEEGGDGVAQPPTDEEFIELCKELRSRLEAGTLPLAPASLCNAIKEMLPASSRALMDLPTPVYTYKAGREKAPDMFKQDLHNLRCVLGCLRVPCVSPPHMEADDTLAALTEQAVKQGHPVQIVTMDRDLLQLVDDKRHVTVLLVSKAPKDVAGGTGAYHEMHEGDVLEQEGYLPSAMADYRSMAGDPSDNIKGVTGIGAKTAVKLIQEYGSMEGVFEALEDGRINKGIPLRSLSAPGSLKQAHMSLLVSKLKGIHVDLPPTADLFKSKGFLREEVEPLLQRLEMVELHKALPELQEALGGHAASPLSAQELASVQRLMEGKDAWAGSAAPPTTTPARVQPGAAKPSGATQPVGPPNINPVGPAPFSVTIDGIQVTHVTDLAQAPAAVEGILQQLLSSEGKYKGLPVPVGVHLGVHLQLDQPAKKPTKAQKKRAKSVSGSPPDGDSPERVNVNRALCVQRIALSWCTSAKPGEGEDGMWHSQHQLQVAVFEFPYGCLLPDSPASDGMAAVRAVWKLLSNDRILKLVHDAKPLHRLGVELGFGAEPSAGGADTSDLKWPLGRASGVRAPLHDTMLAAYVTDLEAKVEDVDVVACQLGLQQQSELQGKVAPAAPAPAALDAVAAEAAAAVAQTWAMGAQMHMHKAYFATYPPAPNTVPSPVERKGPTVAGWKMLTELEQPLQEVLSVMERTGVVVDMEVLQQVAEETDNKITEVEAQVRAISGKDEFNSKSTQDVSDLFFKQLQLPTKGVKQTKAGTHYSTDVDTLEMLQGLHPVVGLISELRSLRTMRQSYLDQLIMALNTSYDNRVHTNFKQNGAVTGRLSSTNPNMQNIPKHDGFFSGLLAAYKPEPGWKLVMGDYSQMELRLLAALSGEEVMVQAYRNNADVHRETAKMVFNTNTLEEVTKEQRQAGKQINFGIIYGMGAAKLSRDLGCPLNVAQGYIQTVREKYPKITALMERNKMQTVTLGYVETRFGRRRFFDFKTDVLRQLRGVPPSQVTALPPQAFLDNEGLRQAGNMPIQGTSADIMKRALVLVASELHLGGLQSRMLLTVHDSLVLEVPPHEVDRVREVVERCMNQADGGLLSLVPLKVDIKVADTWEAAHA